MERMSETRRRLETRRKLEQIVQKIDELANVLADLIPPSVDRHEYAGLVWDRQGPRNNIGSLGPCFYWRTSSWHGPAEYLISLPKGRKPCEGFYLHNDLRAWVEVGSPEMVWDAAKAIPAFIRSLLNRLEKGGEEAERAAGVISKALNTMRSPQ